MKIFDFEAFLVEKDLYGALGVLLPPTNLFQVDRLRLDIVELTQTLSSSPLLHIARERASFFNFGECKARKPNYIFCRFPHSGFWSVSYFLLNSRLTSLSPRFENIKTQLTEDAEEGEIKRAYRKLSKDLHPDKNPSPEARQQSRRAAG